jgi:hypothetical protein
VMNHRSLGLIPSIDFSDPIAERSGGLVLGFRRYG